MVASARDHRRPWGLSALQWAEREGSEGPRLGDQEDRGPPSLKTEERGPSLRELRVADPEEGGKKARPFSKIIRI